MPVDREALVSQLLADEDVRLKPYRDSVGKLTIGVGRNLDDVGLSQEESMYLLANDLRRVYGEVSGALPYFRKLNDARQNVLLNMGFNLGLPKLLEFKYMLGHVSRGEFDQAADAMLQSRWARQVKDRATRLSKVMRTGQL